jgi:predicted dehydrogenase
MLKAAIVGLGRWHRRLVDSVQTNGEPKGVKIRFTRAVHRTPERARDYAAAQRLALGGDLAAALGDPAIDAFAFATPHDQHARQVETAALAGKHVLVEKPFTLTRASAEAAAAAIDDVRAELEAFADAIAGVRPYPLAPAEAVHGVAVLEAALRSAASGGGDLAIP